MIIKFAPDYLLLKQGDEPKLYFLEIKFSVTPCWAKSRIEKINRDRENELNYSNIGEVAREAFLSYKRFYADTIILYASPYNSKILMAQFAEKIECLYCFKKGERDGYDCSNCPIEKGGYFDIERNKNSKGSETPNTNINLDSFESAEEFFKKIGIQLNTETLSELQNSIKNCGINLCSIPDDEIKTKIKNCIKDSGCSWAKFKEKSIGEEKYYICDGNDFYHSSKDCFFISGCRVKAVSKAEAQKSKRACFKCCKDRYTE